MLESTYELFIHFNNLISVAILYLYLKIQFQAPRAWFRHFTQRISQLDKNNAINLVIAC